MKIELLLFVLLCTTLSCNGFLEKLLDPLNVSGAILKRISNANKYDGVQSSGDREYSGVYGGSSSVSYGYGESSGGSINGHEFPLQTGYKGPNQGYVELSQLNNNRELVQGYGYGGPSQGNSFFRKMTQGNYPLSNGFVEEGGYHSVTPQASNLGLTFNVNLGGLLGLGHSKHSHHHGHKHHHGQDYINEDFFSDKIPNGNINVHDQIFTQDGGYDRPEQIGYHNHNSQNFNQDAGFNRPDETGYQNEHNFHDTTYIRHDEQANGENLNPTESNNNNPALNPIYNDRNRTPNESEDSYVSNEPSVVTSTEIVYLSTTENTKTSYENEKNSKITTTNRKTTIRPENDQPLLVPLNPNEYTYEGDKIQIASPKRNVEENKQKQEVNKKEEDFDIDVRFSDDE